MPKVGDTLHTTIRVIDNLSQGIEGLVFHPTINYYGWMPDGSTMNLDRVTWEELGTGDYRFHVATFTPGDSVGPVTLQVNAPGPWPTTYTEQWTLEPRFIYPTTGGTSKATLRRLILSKFGDLIVLKATQNGGTDSLVDEINLYMEPSAYRGREVIFTAGQTQLRGTIRHVSASSRSSMAIQFSTPLPIPTRIGDEVEMVNSYGMGVSVQAVHRAIEYAIAVAQPYALVPVAWEPPAAFDAHTGYITTVPDELVGVESVLWLNPAGEAITLGRGMGQGDPGWAMQHASHGIAIIGTPASAMSGKSLIINGYVLPEIPDNDYDEVHLDREWLINTALAHICLDVIMSRQGSSDWAQRGQAYQSRADILLSKLTPDIGPTFMRF